MRICKLISLISVIMLALALLTGCIIIPLRKYYDDIETDKVSSVEIYDLRKIEEAFMSNFLETESPVYTLSEDQLDGFWNDLAEIKFSDEIIITIAAIDPSFNYGDWVVRINYNDGSFSLISCGGYGETFDSSGILVDSNHYGCDDEEWEGFLSKYIPEEIFKSDVESETF